MNRNELPYRPNPKPTQRQWEKQQLQQSKVNLVCAFWGGLFALGLICAALRWIGRTLAHLTPAAWLATGAGAVALVIAVLGVILAIANSPGTRRRELRLQWEQEIASDFPHLTMLHFPLGMGIPGLLDLRLAYGPLIP